MVTAPFSKLETFAENQSLDIFIQSQLILVSTDLLAHYWKEMGHVSYFRRVDIDALLQT
jgi:hypothetical protein